MKKVIKQRVTSSSINRSPVLNDKSLVQKILSKGVPTDNDIYENVAAEFVDNMMKYDVSPNQSMKWINERYNEVFSHLDMYLSTEYNVDSGLF